MTTRTAPRATKVAPRERRSHGWKTQTEAATALGMSPQGLGQWCKKPGAPVELRDGKLMVKWPDFPRWREAALVAEARAKASPSEAAAKTRRLEADAQLKELALAERQRRLVPVELYETRVGDFVGGFSAVARGRLHAFERDIVAATCPADARLLTERIHRALMEGAQGYADQIGTEAGALEQVAPEAAA